MKAIGYTSFLNMMIQPSALQHLKQLLPFVKDDETLFWILQCLGWTGISLLTYPSLSVPYDQYELSYLAHNIAQSVVGFCYLLHSVPLPVNLELGWLSSCSYRNGVSNTAGVLWAAIRCSIHDDDRRIGLVV